MMMFKKRVAKVPK